MQRTKTALGLSLAADTSTVLHFHSFKSLWPSVVLVLHFSLGQSMMLLQLLVFRFFLLLTTKFNSQQQPSPGGLLVSSLSSFHIWSQSGAQSLGSFGILRTTPQHVREKEMCSLTFFFLLRDISTNPPLICQKSPMY